MPQDPESHALVHELLMVSASVLIVATGLAAIVTDRLLRRGLLGPPDRLFRGEALLVVPLVSLSLGAAAIHFTVIPEHFHEWWAFGLFFVVAAWFQAWWAVLFALRPSRLVAAVGAAVNGAIVVVWAASRTVGLPFGPHPGSVEPIGMADIVATAFEVLILAGGALIALGPGRRVIAPMKMRIAPALMAGTVWVVSVAMATTLGVASLATAASHHGTTVQEQGESQPRTDASGQEPGSHDHGPAAPAPSAGSSTPSTPKPAVVQGGTRKPAPKPSPTPTPAHSHSHP